MRIALTGNIASGKSAVEKILMKKGFQVFDADKIAHRILESSAEIKEVFGTTERKQIAEIVFNNSGKMKLLESIIHPKVKEEILNIESGFVSVPQLFEAGFESIFDKIVLISAPEELRLERLMKRNNLTKEDAQKRISAQISEEEKLSKCDFVIENTSTLENLEAQVDKMLVTIR